MKKTTRRVGLAKRFERVQTEAERVISRGYKATLELLPPGPRKTVKEFTGQIEAAAEALNKRGQQALKLAEKRRKALVGSVEKAARAFSRRSERALEAMETTRLAATVEQAAADFVRPLARRLDIATLSDVERLSKRLAHLERKLGNGTRRAAA